MSSIAGVADNFYLRFARVVLTCVTTLVAIGTVHAAENIDSVPHDLKVPEGFSIELVAGPPLVERPIVAAFDDEGRLYVAESSGSNDKVEQQLSEKPHRVVRLEDADGDGKFDRRKVFADHLMLLSQSRQGAKS
jgi:hypothetical protein